jgi:integration host factor subunit alpha
MSINKKNISMNLSSKIGIPLDVSSNILDTFIELIKINSQNNVIKISQFGSFCYKNSPTRAGRNPKTGESFPINKRSKLTFNSSNKVRKTLN